VLFIVATLTNVFGTGRSRSFLSDPDRLTMLSANANQVTLGALLLELIAAGACAGIAASMYPVLGEWSTGLALGSVVLRTVEAVMYAIAVVSLLSLLTLSAQFTNVGAMLQANSDSLLGFANRPG
jgi:hypothetical protein